MKRWVLLALVVVLSTLVIVNCTQPPVPIPPADPTTPTAVGGIGQAVLNWNQVPGADGYQVRFQVVGSDARGWSQEVNVPAPPYTVEKEAGIYSWQVRAKKGNLYSEWVNGPNFTIQDDPGPSDLTLTLQEVPARGIPTIYVVQDSYVGAPGKLQTRLPGGYTNINYLLAQVISTVPGLETVAYYVQKVGSQDQKRWPNSATTYELDSNGEHTFGMNDLGDNLPLAPGQYWFWVQGTGDQQNVRSQKLRFDVAELESGSIEIVKEVDGTLFPGKICAPEDASIEVDYTITFAFADVDFISWAFFFAYNLDQSIVETEEATGVGKPEEPFEVTVTYATECTKTATVTLDATITAYQWLSGETVEQEIPIQLTKVISFVFDNQPPEAAIEVDPEQDEGWETPGDGMITVATMTFHATDTKCLQPYGEKIFFEFYVWKDYEGLEGWSKTLWFGEEEEFVLGEGGIWDNAINVTVAYDTDKGDEADTAWAQFVFELPERLDMIIVEATMTVFDCCSEGCMVPDDICDPYEWPDGHYAQDTAYYYVDNVFFSAMLEEGGPMWEELKPLAWEGFREGPEDLPMLPGADAEESVRITFQFADSWWWIDDSFEPLDAEGLIGRLYQNWSAIESEFEEYLALEGDFDGDSSNPQDYFTMEIIEATLTTAYATCSGWDEKMLLTFTIGATALETAPPTEVMVTITATATDWEGNWFVVPFEFWLDTKPPTLTYFRAFRNPDIDESKIEFRFDEEPLDVILVLIDNNDDEFPLDFSQATRIGSPSEYMYRLYPNVTIQQGVAYTLRATASDAAGNKGTSELTHTAAAASER